MCTLKSVFLFVKYIYGDIGRRVWNNKEDKKIGYYF